MSSCRERLTLIAGCGWPFRSRSITMVNSYCETSSNRIIYQRHKFACCPVQSNRANISMRTRKSAPRGVP